MFYTYVHVYTYACLLRLEVSTENFPQLVTTLIFEAGALTDPGVTDPTRRAVQEALGILLFLLPSSGVTDALERAWPFTTVLRTQRTEVVIFA